MANGSREKILRRIREALSVPASARHLKDGSTVATCGFVGNGFAENVAVAIEQRSAEVWRILEKAKTEFGKFGDVLDNVKAKLDLASKQIEQTGVRTRAIERSLRDIDTLPGETAAQLEAPRED